jgi:peptide/nickel transport system permease protein
MLSYLLRRVLLAIPTIFMVSLFTFWLSQCAPRDAKLEYSEGGQQDGNYRGQLNTIIAEAKKQHLFLPAFYFSITSSAFPDTLYRVLPLSRREKLCQLTAQTGNWNAQIDLEKTIWDAIEGVKNLPDSLVQKRPLNQEVAKLSAQFRVDTLERVFARMEQNALQLPQIQTHIAQLRLAHTRVLKDQHPEKLWIPAFYWYGLQNQYHHWLSGFVTGDLGRTRSMDLPVWQELKPALWSTMMVSVLAVLLAYLVAIPLGVFMGRQVGRLSDKWVRRLLLFLYSMPVFVLGTLLTGLFVSDAAVFPAIRRFSITPLQGSGTYAVFWLLENLPVILLPILTISMHAIAVLALQMRGGILEVIGQDYIRTARAKGADEETVYWHHAFRNALFPIITVFSSLFPTIFTGSIVIERLFNFYGIGSKTMDAIHNADYPVLFVIVMLAATVSIIGNLIADILYAWADPRVRFSK